jgi:hypothetical protein
VKSNNQIDLLEKKSQQLVNRLIGSNFKTEFINKTKEEIQKFSEKIAQHYDRSKYDELEKRLNEIENDIIQEEITRKEVLDSKISAIKSRAQNRSQKSNLNNSTTELSNVLKRNTCFDSKNVESNLLVLDKKAKNLFLLESLHNDLIARLSESYSVNEYYAKTKQDIDRIYEGIPVDYEQHFESLKMQMQRIKDDIVQNDINCRTQEMKKKENFRARCSENRKIISTMLDESKEQNIQEELLVAEKRLTNFWNSIPNSNSSNFQAKESSLCEYENSKNNLKTKLDAKKSKNKDENNIKNVQNLFSKWNQQGKLFEGAKYFEQMLDQCQQKLENSISMKVFYKNINELIDTSNEEFHQMHYPTSHYINIEDMKEFYKIFE